MERRSFFGILAGAVAGLFVPAKMFDFGKPSGYQTYVFGKNAQLGGIGSPSEQPVPELRFSEIPGWTSYRFAYTVTPAPDNRRIINIA